MSCSLKGRTPLHFALGNADRSTSPSVVQHLLSENLDIVNAADKDGQLPLHLLSTQANRLQPDQKIECNNAKKCLELYLKANPRATSDFFTALQSLPRFLREQAVVTPFVQDVLNQKISKRFPTMMLMLAFYFIVLIIVSFGLAVSDAIDFRYKGLEPGKHFQLYLYFLYLGGIFFLIREVIQMISLASMGLFKTWLFDGTNMLDVLCIIIVFFWTIVMQVGALKDTPQQKEAFRSGTAVSTGILWGLVLSFLKSTSIDFAVFVNGVFYVVQRLVAFLLALIIILVAFAQMFLTVFRGTEECATGEPFFAFCKFGTSLLWVYTMMLGQVDQTDFNSEAAGDAIYAATAL